MDLILKGGPIPSSTFGTPLTPAVVDPTFGALRVILKPEEWNNNGFNGGHYRAAQVSGALAGAGAASLVFSMRWALANGIMLLKRVQIGYAITTAFTTGQLLDFDIIRASAFTAADTGGTALTPFTGNNNKKRTQLMATSQVTDMRISATAALGAGTKTLDANPFGFISANPINLAVPTATVSGGSLPLTDIYSNEANSACPEVFGVNEGFNIRVITALGAAGAIKLYVVVDWVEAPGL